MLHLGHVCRYAYQISFNLFQFMSLYICDFSAPPPWREPVESASQDNLDGNSKRSSPGCGKGVEPLKMAHASNPAQFKRRTKNKGLTPTYKRWEITREVQFSCIGCDSRVFLLTPRYTALRPKHSLAVLGFQRPSWKLECCPGFNQFQYHHRQHYESTSWLRLKHISFKHELNIFTSEKNGFDSKRNFEKIRISCTFMCLPHKNFTVWHHHRLRTTSTTVV